MIEPLDEKHVISFQNALIVGIIIVLSYATISISLNDYEDLRTDLLNTIIIITDLLAEIGLIYGAYNSKYNKKVQIAWVLLAVSRLCFTAGDFIYAYLESVKHLGNVFPSIADAGVLPYLCLRHSDIA